MADFIYKDISEIKKLGEFRYALILENFESLEAILTQDIKEPTLF